MSAEGLQRGVDAGVCTQGGLVLVGESFVFVELGEWRRLGGHVVLHEIHGFWHAAVPLVVVSGDKEVFYGCRGGRPGGAWKTGGSGFTLWTLMKR